MFTDITGAAGKILGDVLSRRSESFAAEFQRGRMQLVGVYLKISFGLLRQYAAMLLNITGFL